VSRSIEILFKRGKIRIWDLDRPQKPLVFYNKPKVKSKTSKMDFVSILI